VAVKSSTEDSNEIAKSYRSLLDHVSSLKQRYKTLYDGSPDLLRTINCKGIVLDCNESYARHLGYSKEELIGTSIFETVAEDSIDLMHASFEAWKKTGTVKNREAWFERKNGTTFPVLISANNLYDENRKLIGSNTVIRDISEIYHDKKIHRELEKKLKKSFEQHKIIDQEKKEYTEMITRELKLAATEIKSEVNVLMSTQLDTFNGSQLETLDKIKFKSRAILKMLSNISYVEKIESGDLNLIENECDMSQVVIGAISKLKDDVNFHGCTITTDLQERLWCVCDKMRIEEVLSQLISNAIDFSPRGIGKVHVKLCYYSKKYAKIIVKDNGIGIVQDKLEKIFEKFYQLDTYILRKHGGAGLGLFVCKGIVEGHQGKIWAESEGLDKGAELHVLLPLISKDREELEKIE